MNRLNLNNQEGLVTPKTVYTVFGAGVCLLAGAVGFLDAAGFKISNERGITEGSEIDVKLQKIIPAPKLQLVTLFSSINGAHQTQLYKRISAGRFQEDIPVPGMVNRTEFRNDVPVEVNVEGKDLNTFKFTEGNLDTVTGKPYVIATVDLANLRFDTKILEGVAITDTPPSQGSESDEDQNRPLIIDSDPATAEVIKNQLQNSINLAQAACELIPGKSKEDCDFLDFFHIEEFIETQAAINNSDARIAGMESTQKCIGQFWDRIIPALEKALTEYIASFYDMTEEEAARLVIIQYKGSKPDFTKSIISDYIANGTLTDFATKYAFDLRVSDELDSTCSAEDVELELVKQQGTNALEAKHDSTIDEAQNIPNHTSEERLS
jgi:hypothetical protein